MSATIQLTLTRHADDHGRGAAWHSSEQRTTWLYPDDPETFRDALDDIDALTPTRDGEDSEEYDMDTPTPCDDLRRALTANGQPDLIPATPEGWEHAELTLTIYW